MKVHLSAIHVIEANAAFHQNRFSGAALSNNQVGFSLFEDSTYVIDN
jgi:hypothetical protein